MATVALPAFLALVHVILSMAGVTGFTELLLAKDSLVTGCTLDLIVPASQRESTQLEMVEPGSSPAICGVAFIALSTELAMVALAVIILPMT